MEMSSSSSKRTSSTAWLGKNFGVSGSPESDSPLGPDGPRPVLTGATGATGVRHSSCLSRGCSTWGMCRDVVNYAVYWP